MASPSHKKSASSIEANIHYWAIDPVAVAFFAVEVCLLEKPWALPGPCYGAVHLGGMARL